MHVLDDLDVFTGADVFAAASAAKLHIGGILTLHFLLLLLLLSHLLLCYRLKLKLIDLMKEGKEAITENSLTAPWEFHFKRHDK